MNQNKSDQEIKDKYASILKKAKIISGIFILLILPRLVLSFSDLETFLGFNYVTALIPLAIAVIIAGGFYYKYWRCPACNEFPGDSWSRETCKKCNVVLK